LDQIVIIVGVMKKNSDKYSKIRNNIKNGRRGDWEKGRRGETEMKRMEEGEKGRRGDWVIKYSIFRDDLS